MLVGILRVLILSQFLFCFAGGSPVSGDGTSKSILGGLILLSAALFVSLVIFLMICVEGGCWPLRYFRRDGVAAAGIENPLSDSGGLGLAEMDVRALELDPIVFEPLPTLSDLTPRRRDQEELHVNGKYLGAIVPFSSPESHAYAHDWFDEPFRNFPRGNIQYIREVGIGWFGQVIEGEARDIVPYAKKMRVVVKVLRGEASDAEQMRFLDESRLYRDGNHGNILKLLGHSIETNPFLLLMEYCVLGDLKSYLIANVSRAEVLNSRGDVLRMCLDIAKGLEWMAGSDFTHGDLAARNCQVGSEGRILIGDYGLSTQIYKDDYYWSSNIAIPLRWAAPETLHCTINTIQTLRVTKESNVWTFGILLWEITEFGKLPYFELTDDDVISRVFCEKNYVLGEPTMPSILLREEIYSLMTACWSPNPIKRPSISSCVQRLQTLTSLPSRKNDEFDIKWENTQNQLRKKSVSFSGEPSPLPQPPVNFVISTPPTPAAAPFSKTQIEFEKRDDPFPSHDLWKSLDPEEEDFKKRIERGEITQKVREKSESVQDLMILTHVEPSDFSDGESLVILDPSPPLCTLRRAASETAINSSGKGSSQFIKSTPFLLSTPGNSNGTKGLSPINKTGIDFRFTAPTPSPGIEINVIQATPTPVKRQVEPSSLEKEEVPTRKGHIKRRFVFRDEDPGRGGVRHTSTPIRSPSPVDTLEGDSEVFDSPRPEDENEKCCQISPISQAASNNSIHSYVTSVNSKAYTVAVVGAVDDLGLGPYQSVTSSVEIPPSRGVKRTAGVIPKKLIFNEEALASDSWTQIASQSQSQPESWLIYTKGEGTQDESEFMYKETKEKKLSAVGPTVEMDAHLNSNNTHNDLPPPLSNSLEKNVKVRFREEIAGVNAEVGSLLFHDLEGTGEFKLIHEDREEEEGMFTPILTTRTAFGGEVGGDESLSLSMSPTDDLEPVPFVPSKWNSCLNPAKSAIRTPETGEDLREGSNGGIRKSVSFERKKRPLVYEYPPPTPQPDSEEEDHVNPTGPLALSLDWELDADEMEDVVEDDWDVEATGEPNSPNPMDVYRISPFGGSGYEDPPGLGGLRHTREKLKLDLRKRNDGSTLENPKLDSGVGSSTNVSPSPFSHCDNNTQQPTNH